MKTFPDEAKQLPGKIRRVNSSLASLYLLTLAIANLRLNPVSPLFKPETGAH